jgi:hypothetical protein
VLWLGAGLGGGLLSGVGDGLLVAGAGPLLAAAVDRLGVLACLVGGFGLDLCAGGLQFGQALLAAVQLGGQVGVLAVDAEGLVLGGVGGLGVGSRAVARASREAISASIRSSWSTSRP